jgi:hypothetical protein
MKAEHRKELETNVLADRVGKFVEAMRGGPKGALRIWIVVGLVAIAIGLGYYLYQSTYTDTSRLWTQLDAAKDAQQLEELAKDNSGTIPARTARFEVARIFLAEGVQNLGSPVKLAGGLTTHEDAVQKLEKARTLYEELSNEARDVPMLAQEAMMGSAKAEESLSGTPKADNPKETRGTLQRAMELYQKLADAQPETFQARAAKEKVKELQDAVTRAKLQEFYVQLNQQVVKKP